MALDLTKLTEAVTAVAGVAAENAALKSDQKAAQDHVDALTASLLAAVTSPAEAVGVAAVAAALAPEAPRAPLTVDELNAQIAAANAAPSALG